MMPEEPRNVRTAHMQRLVEKFNELASLRLSTEQKDVSVMREEHGSLVCRPHSGLWSGLRVRLIQVLSGMVAELRSR